MKGIKPMDPNDNHPSEREWTLEEQEEFFGSQDAVTGLLGGGVAKFWSKEEVPTPITLKGLQEAYQTLEETLYRGIHVISITPPKSGWPMAIHCPLCRETTFFLSPYACKPTEDGKEFDGYHLINDMCGNAEHSWQHNIRLGMKGWNAPIDLKPEGLIKFQVHDPLPPQNMSPYMLANHIFSPYDAEFTQELPIEEVKRRWPNTKIPGETE
jgi:hypothetical protein